MTKNKQGAFSKQRRKQLIFYCCLLVIPVVQFCIFYLGVNINSILLMFKEYDVETGYRFVGFQNFISVFREMTSPSEPTHEILVNSLRNSVIFGCLTIFVGIVLAVFFSYYIFKKNFGSGLFKIFLFLPQMISSVVLVIIFNKFTDSALPALIEQVFGVKTIGLLSNVKTTLPTLMLYCVFIGFGTQVMMYSGAMSAISASVVEAAELDGCTPFKEFIFIIVPMIYPTITTFVVVNIATMFVQQMNLFSFYGPNATDGDPNITTFGYYLYKEAYSGSRVKFPRIATLGFYMTLVSIPTTYLIKWLLEKVGPSED